MKIYQIVSAHNPESMDGLSAQDYIDASMSPSPSFKRLDDALSEAQNMADEESMDGEYDIVYDGKRSWTVTDTENEFDVFFIMVVEMTLK